jgi:hypothetical protein
MRLDGRQRVGETWRRSMQTAAVAAKTSVRSRFRPWV